MFVVRFAASALLASAFVACSDQIDPRDGPVEEPIPAGVSVAPQRSTPQTGGLNIAAQDTTVPTAEMPGIMDTTRAGAAAPAAPAASPAPAADTAAMGTNTAPAPRPR